jgi:D-arabinose 1-dehydrogenase-like Zn-dependent alcohol dehydrogenase
VLLAAPGEIHKKLGRPCDVALELVGAPTFNASLRALRTGGRLALIGNVTTGRIEVNPGYLIVREIAVYGSAGATRADLAEVLGWAAAGRLEPIVEEKLPLAEAARAQSRLAQRGALGRTVLVP